MNIVLYGVPAKTAGRIAGQYGLKVINSPDKFDASGTMVLVPPISTPRYLLAFYNAMLRHEDDVDAVIICGAESCEAVSTVQYCTPLGKFFTLNGDLDGEELVSELWLLLDSLFAEGAFPSRPTSISRGFWMKPIRRTVNWGCLWAECC